MDTSMVGTLGGVLGLVIQVGAVISLLYAGYLKVRSTKIPWGLYVTAGFLVGLVVGPLLPRPVAQRAISISFPATNIYTGSADVRVTSSELMLPNTIFVAGTYKNVPDEQDIWLYVRATNNRYYARAAQKHKDGTWGTIEKTNIGDETKLGGTYEVGLLLAESGADKCLDPGNKEGIGALPPCATVLSSVIMKRT